jgi:hypothetical protein
VAVSTRIPSPTSAARTSSPANGSSRGSSRSRASTTGDLLGPEPPHRLGHLEAHRAAAQNEQPARHLLEFGHVAVVPGVRLRQTGHRRQRRPGPGGEDDGSAGPQHALGSGAAGVGRVPGARQPDDDTPGSVEPRLAAKDGDPPLEEPSDLARVVVPADQLVAPLERPVDVDRCRDGLPGAGHALGGRHHVPGAQQRLARYAAPVRAFAADQLALDDGDGEAPLGAPARHHLPGRAGSEDGDVDDEVSG